MVSVCVQFITVLVRVVIILNVVVIAAGIVHMLELSAGQDLLPSLAQSDELAKVIDSLLHNAFVFAQKGDVASSNRNAPSISHGIRMDIARTQHQAGTFSQLMECISVRNMQRLLQDAGTSLPVMKGGFCRGHYVAGLIYGVAASPRNKLSAAQRRTFDRVVKTFVPEMTDQNAWQGDQRARVMELDADFGKGNNTFDYLRVYAIGGDNSTTAMSSTYQFLVEALAQAQGVSYEFTVQGPYEIF